MGLVVFCFLMIFLIASVSALKITEVELNPPLDDSGFEWIELYSETNVDLSNYKLVNGDGGEINLNGTFSGYFIYTFPKQWLDNSNESVYLYEGNNLIDKTDILADSKNNDLTWQYCNSWEFKESTKGKENECDNENKDENQNIENNTQENNDNNFNDNLDNTTENQNIENNQDNINANTELSEEEIMQLLEKYLNESDTKTTKKEITKEPIKLNAQTIKSEKNSEDNDLNTKKLATYGFVLFCFLIGGLMILRKKKYKNEFK